MKTPLRRAVVVCALALAVLPRTASAQILYEAQSGTNSFLNSRDPNHGTGVQIGQGNGTIGTGVGAMAVDPSTGVLYGVSAPGSSPSGTNRQLLRIDRRTGVGTVVGTLNLGNSDITDIAFRADGTLFGWSENSDDLITIDLMTGEGTIVGDSGISTFGSGLAFDTSGTLWLAGDGSDGVLRTVNTTTGITTVASPPLTGSPAPGFPLAAMKFNPSTNVLYAINKTATNFSQLVRINPTTGVMTDIGALGPTADALAWGATPRQPDFEADSHADLVLRNTSTGDVALMLFSNPSAPTTAAVAAGVPLTWHIAGTGDLNGDGRADLVWREGVTGDVAAWFMHGAAVTAIPVIASGLPLAWQIAAIGDLDGDGKADLVWRHSQTGDVAVWLMNGATVQAIPVIASGVPLAWHIDGIGDLDSDGRADLIWRHTQSGDVAVWMMDGAKVLIVPVIASGVPLAWHIKGVGDLNADGRVDLVWQNQQTGDVAVWLMYAYGYGPIPVIATGVPSQWQIVHVQDVNGDNHADLVWYHSGTGSVATWLMNGTTVTSTPGVGALSAEQEIQ